MSEVGVIETELSGVQIDVEKILRLDSEQKQNISERIGRSIHEQYRKFMKRQGISEELRSTNDREWLKIHNETKEVDLVEVHYDDLPRDWKEVNTRPARLMIDFLQEYLQDEEEMVELEVEGFPFREVSEFMFGRWKEQTIAEDSFDKFFNISFEEFYNLARGDVSTLDWEGLAVRMGLDNDEASMRSAISRAEFEVEKDQELLRASIESLFDYFQEEIDFTTPESNQFQAKSWLSDHLECHSPIVREEGVWRNSEGEILMRSVEREKSAIDSHLEYLKENEPEYHQKIVESTEKLPSMKDDVRVVVAIPAWKEGGNIYRLLEEYTKQIGPDGEVLDSSMWEIMILVNRKTGDESDSTVEEIERFQQDSENVFNIHYLDVEFDPPLNNVGNARRWATDVTLMRSVARENQAQPLYIESEDADLVRVDPKTVINVIEKFDNNPQYDALLGRQDRYPEILKKNDYLFLYRRLDDITKILHSRKRYRLDSNPNADFMWNRAYTSGWNTAITAEALALIHGYDPLMAWGEDLAVGVRLSMARGDGENPNLGVVGRVYSRSDSSPRRFLHSIAAETSSYGENFTDPEINQIIRSESDEELLGRIDHLARINPNNLIKFEELLTHHFRIMIDRLPSYDVVESSMRLVMWLLGFKTNKGEEDFEFDVENKEVRIVDFSNIKKSLDDYREKHKSEDK